MSQQAAYKGTVRIEALIDRTALLEFKQDVKECGGTFGTMLRHYSPTEDFVSAYFPAGFDYKRLTKFKQIWYQTALP